MKEEKPSSKQISDFLYNSDLKLYQRILNTIDKKYDYLDSESLTSYYNLLQTIRPSIDKKIVSISKSELFNNNYPKDKKI